MILNKCCTKNLSLELLLDPTKYKKKDKGFYENVFFIKDENKII